ncbi:prenyltransferase/squalene oxidase repeat-containing protein [Paenibacillus sp. HB172176]|uniref:terpene cyclase/mutase family protein n=1 Tax=Paenibacillus sp. HB172176 TaxID=2493690 RepID=UPI00143B83A4|nr:prenyltransferase/squalene oxidase repeat-containing protein [Paenibacillus sp. HB172176]
MDRLIQPVNEEIGRLSDMLSNSQHIDGAWRYCFENGTSIDAYVIIILRILQAENEEELIQKLHSRILAEQKPNGCWKLFFDEEEGNLSATIDAYYGLLFSGFSKPSDEAMQRARRFIQMKGGIGKAEATLTKALLAATGQMKWPLSISSIPIEALLLPSSFPVHFFSFSGYARVHLAPMLIMADLKFGWKGSPKPDLSDLLLDREASNEEELPPEHNTMLDAIAEGLKGVIGSPRSLHEAALDKAEQFILDRIEADGTLYSYASSTILMILSLLALGYDRKHPVLTRAAQAFSMMRCDASGRTTIQNSPSTIWDTALLAYTLQQASSDSSGAAQRAVRYLLPWQQRKLADWSIGSPSSIAGGWGFSERNTLNPDVDDTTAALRAVKCSGLHSAELKSAWNRGLQWVLFMQNRDGGWPAFEKNKDNRMLTWLAIEGAKSAAIDPSEADLTGRTLEFLGQFAGFDHSHSFMKRGVDWLIRKQERDGSWYGRWGICYIYGTWAALTGMRAAGLTENHASIRKGADWLQNIQNSDGGWGESCRSDQLKRYVPLGGSTPSQTAWALDALIAAEREPGGSMRRGVEALLHMLREDSQMNAYPTGAGLPGSFYVRYHSYQHIWPLLALIHFRKKFLL